MKDMKKIYKKTGNRWQQLSVFYALCHLTYEHIIANLTQKRK